MEDGLVRPIIILGAPRSGTSLLQRILRGCDGCGAVAAESERVWRPYTHPQRFDWSGESWAPGEIDARTCTRIRRQLRRRVLPASTWRRVDAARVVERQRALRLPRWILNAAYSALVGTRNTLEPRATRYRLVEKSVHAGLWAGLPGRVFPDATFIHLVREPWATLASMERGWHQWRRFRTYRLPEPLRIPDCSSPDWCFPLPAGWKRYLDRPVADVVAFQWCAIQSAILEQLGSGDTPVIRVRLEDLAADPAHELRRLANALSLPWDSHLQGFAAGLPRVNAGQSTDTRLDPGAIGDGQLLERVERLSACFGY